MNICYDYSRLSEKIKAVFTKRMAFAKAMGMSQHTLSFKMNGKREFTQSEIVKACNLLGIPAAEIPDYFFAYKVQAA